MRPEEAEQRLRDIASALVDVVWIGDWQRLIYVSPAYERIWMRSCDSLAADPESFLRAIHPADRERVVADLAVMAQGLPFEHEYRIVRADGSVRWIFDRGAAVLDAEGKVDYYVGVAQDVTVRKSAELELASLADRIRLISLATKDGFWDWDMVTGDAWWSDSIYEAFGYERTVPATYEGWVARIHPDDRPRVLANFKRAIEQSGAGWSDDYRVVHVDGTIRHVFDRAYLIRDDANQPARMIGTMMDVTERRSLEAQLRHAQKMEAVGQLAGGIAHDFNNILQAILLQVNLLRRVPGLPRLASDGLAEVRTAAESAANLTRQLLVFSRREHMQPRWLDVNEVIADLARMLERVVREDITVALSLAPSPIWVHADRGMLEQVIVNLAVNARDAMPRGGTLTIATGDVQCGRAGQAMGRHARVVVSDTGTGIAADVLPHIFEPFFTTKDPGHGTGLGLATAFGIVEQHRGWIDVDSRLGQGTSFSVFLPVGAPPVERVDRADDAPRGVAPASGETILVVEDDASLRRLVRQVFEEQGYRVIEAAHAAAALAACERERGIDLVLTDLVMPGGVDGWELVEQLEKRKPAIRVVIATGYHKSLAGRDLGRHAVLHKPVSAELLLATVRTSLDAR
jgi:PAS domain S-box-containing protein